MQVTFPATGRLILPTNNTFWDWELAGTTLTTRSGAVGKNGRSSAKRFTNAVKALAEIDRKHFQKLRDGYIFRVAENPGSLLLERHFSSTYTGFTAMADDPHSNTIFAARHTGHGDKRCELVAFDATTGIDTQCLPLKEFDLWKLHPHGGSLYWQADGRVKRVNPTTGTIQPIGTGGMFPFLEFDLQGDRLLLSHTHGGQCVLEVLTLPTLESVWRIDVSAQRHVDDHKIHHVAALSPSGRWVAFCRQPGRIELYDLERDRRRTITGTFPCLQKIAFHPSEEWFAGIEQYGQWLFRAWSIAGEEDTRWQKLKYIYPDGSVNRNRECFDFAFAPSGKVVALREGATVRLHDCKTRRLRTRIPIHHVARPWNTGGLHLQFTTTDQLLTRTDSGVIALHAP